MFLKALKYCSFERKVGLKRSVISVYGSLLEAAMTSGNKKRYIAVRIVILIITAVGTGLIYSAAGHWSVICRKGSGQQHLD